MTKPFDFKLAFGFAFELKSAIPVGRSCGLTVGPKREPDGTELLLEPGVQRAAARFEPALVEDGIPATSFQLDDSQPSLTD